MIPTITKTWDQRWAPGIRSVWSRQRVWVLGVAVVLMVLACLHRSRNEFWRLLYDSSVDGAVDLIFHHKVVQLWFGGEAVYGRVGTAYPPASFVILWPFTGWLDVVAVRWFWAITTVLALVWIIGLIIRASGAQSKLERLFVALMPLAMYATWATVGNGQFIIHLFPGLIAGLAMVARKRNDWGSDVLSAGLLLFTLVKPTVAAPFFWIVMFVPGRIRVAVLVVLGYVGLSMFAASFQSNGLLELQEQWTRAGAIGTARGAATGGHSNLSTWLVRMGLKQFNVPASLVVLAMLGYWVYRHRRADLWMLMGVSALVARLWIYHRLYDDFLLLLPMVTLFRMAKQPSSSDGRDVTAGVLLAILWIAALAPARLLVGPWPWNALFEIGQTTIWIVVLIFLLIRTRHDRLVGAAP